MTWQRNHSLYLSILEGSDLKPCVEASPEPSDHESNPNYEEDEDDGGNDEEDETPKGSVPARRTALVTMKKGLLSSCFTEVRVESVDSSLKRKAKKARTEN